ncbi:hypothetical protein Poly30_03990 [Planctomycetes bacterium Poly30]|uniref:DUF4168 domain-containing protein n=1 Tax=Saltatorellus ferox TaxID=2528018 RepID=A0A518ELC9_9BACT|nr:hypothetical protein Poly30_03990 [Planctomycetes bacterium Poly30]
MKQLLPVAVATLCLLVSASCGGSDSLTGEMTATTSQFVETLKGIDSKEAAEAAAPKLKEIAAQMKAIQTKVEALPKEEQEALTKKAEGNKEMNEITTGMMNEMRRLMKDPEIAAVLGPVMDAMDN